MLAKADREKLSAAVRDAKGAREAAEDVRAAVEDESDQISKEAMLLRRKLERAFSKLEQAPRPLPSSRTTDERGALSRDATTCCCVARAGVLEGHSIKTRP
eukprot:5727664-Pleurochrysis_carterae.AAC.1